MPIRSLFVVFAKNFLHKINMDRHIFYIFYIRQLYLVLISRHNRSFSRKGSTFSQTKDYFAIGISLNFTRFARVIKVNQMNFKINKQSKGFKPITIELTIEDKWELLELIKRLDISTASIDRFYNKDDEAAYPDVYFYSNNRFHSLWSDLDDIYESISHLYEEDEEQDQHQQSDSTIEIDTDDVMNWLDNQEEEKNDNIRVGDIVEIVDHNFNHGFSIGEKVVIVSFRGSGRGSETKIWSARSLDSDKQWFVTNKDFKKSTLASPSSSDEFKVGDTVEITHQSLDSKFNAGDIVVLKRSLNPTGTIWEVISPHDEIKDFADVSSFKKYTL